MQQPLPSKTHSNRSLYYRLHIVFGLFFLFPVGGFIIFGIKHHILSDEYIPLFFLGILAFSFFGYLTLRRLFDEITQISKRISEKSVDGRAQQHSPWATDELHSILRSFNAIENQFRHTCRQLDQKTSELSILKELSELCFVTFDPEEILNVTLERALLLTAADMGSVLILDQPDRNAFTVKACIGLGEFSKVNDRIDYETSIAKYAVINKSPLVVSDIEKDTRFGRANRPHYGTKSFICMPIKTSKEIIGVLTISRRQNGEPFVLEDVEILTPLLSNAAFTYENLRLLRENDRFQRHMGSIEKIFKVLNSSFRDSELLQAFLNELRSMVPYLQAVILTHDATRPNYLTVLDLVADPPTALTRGAGFDVTGTMMEKVLKQALTLMVKDSSCLSLPVEKALLARSGGMQCLLVPLKTDGQVKGLLILSANAAHPFQQTQDMVEWIAHGLSLAIERNGLSAAVMRRDNELETIKQIGSALASSTFDSQKVLNYTMDMIRVIMNVEAGSLFLVKENRLEFAAAFNWEVKSLKPFCLKLGQGIAGYVAARGEPLIVNNTGQSPHFYAEVDHLTGFKTRSALCVPMISQGRVIGVLEVLNKITGDFSAGDKDLLLSIAASVSIAMENARLYKETAARAENERGIRRMFQKFVPKQVLDRILGEADSGRSVLEEFRTLTLLNLDIRGFSKIAMKIGPQKTVSLLNTFFSEMGGIVFDHQGIVDKYLGDGFLALFGVPVSSTRDADNALAAALAMKRALVDLNRRLADEYALTLNVGISIHTGEVVVGNIGFDMKMDYTVIGDAVNAVFRLQTLTKSFPNGILISEATRRATRAPVKVRDIGERCDIDDAHGKLKIFELMERPESIAA